MKFLSFVLSGLIAIVGAECLLVPQQPAHAAIQTAVQVDQAESKTKSETVGVVSSKPEAGPFVEIEGGFMVPYTAKIPGTDVEFTMIPIQTKEIR